MLVATILSQNTNDKNSHRAYVKLRSRFGDWSAVAEAQLRQIAAAIREGGMSRQKSVRIRGTLRHVKERFADYSLEQLRGLPAREVIDELTKIKGVGVKTAACVLLFSFGRDVFPVDTHIHRICARLGLTDGRGGPEKTFGRMAHLVPAGKAYSLHTNMIRFGRKICRATTPVCGKCPLYDDCVYTGKSSRRGKSSKHSATDHNFMLLDNVR
jgi:endonuclease-3